jgi:hypothetical protein
MPACPPKIDERQDGEGVRRGTLHQVKVYRAETRADRNRNRMTLVTR